MNVLDRVFYKKDNLKVLNDNINSDQLQFFFQRLHSSQPLSLLVLSKLDKRLKEVSQNEYQYMSLLSKVKGYLNVKWDEANSVTK